VGTIRFEADYIETLFWDLAELADRASLDVDGADRMILVTSILLHDAAPSFVDVCPKATDYEHHHQSFSRDAHGVSSGAWRTRARCGRREAWIADAREHAFTPTERSSRSGAT